MATVTESESRSRLDPQVIHPLDRLRGTIRKYVVIEGFLSAAIFLAAWFAFGLLFDFGLFKVATWDWVLDAPAWLRVVALVVAALLLAGIVFFRIAARLTTELSYPSLALVLERKFPKVLGDRLITAVELADVERQSRYGYSSQMIHMTIDEARERVGTVPVNDVFNWKRLRNMAALAVGLLVAVVVTGFVAFAIGNKSANPIHFGWRFAHVTGTFLERNVLIDQVPWPRRVHLEFAGFDGPERRIPKDSPETEIKVKAYRWVLADRESPMGWRPIHWGDLNERLIGGPAPAIPVEAFRIAAEGGLDEIEPAEWPVDRIQAIGMDDKDARDKVMQALPGPEYEALRNGLERVFTKLDELAAAPSMGRTLRRLDVPDSVVLNYSGAAKSGNVTLGAQKNQEFAAPITELKESVHFVVRAEDFRTPSKAITLVPPPMFTSLSRTEWQPAYLHHTPPDFNYAALHDRKQLIVEKALSLTGDRSPISVPSGTELTIAAKLDTNLTAAYLVPKVGLLPGARPGSSERIAIPVEADQRTVIVKFDGEDRLAAGRSHDHYFFDEEGRLSFTTVETPANLEFDLLVEQADGISARRQFSIQIVEDQPPTVEIAAETIRKVGNLYYVTPRAKIPFNPESYIRDDHGLSKVAYEFTYWSEDSDLGRALRVQLMTRPLLYAFNGPNAPAAASSIYHTVKFKDLDKGDQRQNGSAVLPRFISERAELQLETSQTLAEMLRQPRDETAKMISKVDLRNPDVDYFDLKPLKLQANVSEVQTRYRMDLNIVATDTNFDTGPKTGQNAEPIRLLIVSEGDLLAEINKEEAAFAQRLDDALLKMAAARKRWEVVRSFHGMPERIDDARVKAADVAQDVGKCRDVAQGLVREYRRIHRECIVNDVTEAARDHFGKFANRIDRVAGENPPLIGMEVVVPPKMTFPETERRLDVVQLALNTNLWSEVETVIAAELALLELERELKIIRQELIERDTKEKLKAQLQKVIDDQERIGKNLAELREQWEVEQFKKDPKIGTIGPVFLTKGEAKKLRHSINWRQYEKDEIVLKLSVVDKDKKPVAPDVLGIPKELKLDFEKNQTSFDYDVKAGAKDGEYTLMIVPAVGDPVSVIVTVK